MEEQICGACGACIEGDPEEQFGVARNRAGERVVICSRCKYRKQDGEDIFQTQEEKEAEPVVKTQVLITFYGDSKLFDKVIVDSDDLINQLHNPYVGYYTEVVKTETITKARARQERGND